MAVEGTERTSHGAGVEAGGHALITVELAIGCQDGAVKGRSKVSSVGESAWLVVRLAIGLCVGVTTMDQVDFTTRCSVTLRVQAAPP